MVELRTNLTFRADPLRPVDDHRIASSAKVARDLFGPLKWSVHRPRPTDWDVRLARGTTDFIDSIDGALQPQLHSQQASELAKRTLEAALSARTVVPYDVHH